MTDSHPPDPRAPGMEPIFRHLDDADMAWQKVRAQRNADGSESFVREKWLAFSPEPQYLSLCATYDPGMIVRRHGHFSPHIVFVMAGQLLCGERLCPAGTHIELPLGAAFGPLVLPATLGEDGGGTFSEDGTGRLMLAGLSPIPFPGARVQREVVVLSRLARRGSGQR